MKPFRSILLTVALITIGAACGSDKPATTSTGPPVFTIIAKDSGTPATPGPYSFTIPTLTGGVVTLELDNSGGGEPHDFQLIRATEGHTLADVTKQVASEEAPLEPWLQAAGGVGAIAPKAKGRVTQQLPAGTYWYFCTESNSEGEQAVPHATNGMSGELKVTGDSKAALPKTTATITAVDYNFTSTGFKAGSNTFSFENTGEQLHHALVVPIVAGKTVDDVKQAFLSESPSGPPPVDFENAFGTPVLDPRQKVVVTADFKSGTNYVLLCFLPDKGTAGPPHAAKGMLVELKIP